MAETLPSYNTNMKHEKHEYKLLPQSPQDTEQTQTSNAFMMSQQESGFQMLPVPLDARRPLGTRLRQVQEEDAIAEFEVDVHIRKVKRVVRRIWAYSPFLWGGLGIFVIGGLCCVYWRYTYGHSR